MKILVTGAAGYVGRQLASRLLAEGHEVRCMVRDDLRYRAPSEQCGVVEADALRPETLRAAVEHIDVAYYLIHSMSGTENGFAERDRLAAYNFADAAKRAGVCRIIYLGGLGSRSSPLSAHLKSRHETGAVLRKFGPPLIEFRAGIVVGNGSTSFEIIRCLTERLPLMICPRWVTTRTQPIGVDDLLAYLIAALKLQAPIEQPIEIGGATVETFRSMMLGYARQRGLKRWLLEVPLLTTRLSSYWLDFVTPFPPAVTRPLIDSVRSESICTTSLGPQLFPDIQPSSYDHALAKALNGLGPSMRLLSAGGQRTMHNEGLICHVTECTMERLPEHPQRAFSPREV